MNKANENKGTFPANTGRDRSSRFVVPARPKRHSSFDENKGEFPVKTSRGDETRFVPPKI